MTDIVERATAALEGTTPGTWEVTGGVVWVDDVIAVPDPNDPTGQTPMPERVQEKVCDSSPGDARFIAAARTLVPELIAEVEHLRSVVGGACRECGHLRDEHGDGVVHTACCAIDKVPTPSGDSDRTCECPAFEPEQ